MRPGTESSNPSPSSGESPTNLKANSPVLAGEAVRLEREFAGPVFHRGEQCSLLRHTEQSGRKLASGGETTGAQDAAVQIGSIRPALAQHACRRPQQLQPSTPSRVAIHAPDLPGWGGDTVANCRRGRVTGASALIPFPSTQVNLTMPQPVIRAAGGYGRPSGRGSAGSGRACPTSASG